MNYPDNSSKEIDSEIVIGVEGKDDKWFLRALIEYLEIEIKPFFWNYSGKSDFHKKIAALKTTPGFSRVKSIGITRDANGDFNSARQSIVDALKKAGLPVPTNVSRSISRTPNISIYIFPKPKCNGQLEDLCLEAVKNDSATDCIEKYFNCLSQQNLKQDDISKAKAQAFLSSREKTVLRLGEAGYWNFEDPVYNDLKRFLSSLFTCYII